MTTLNDLKNLIERSEVEARSGDEALARFYGHFGALGGDLSIGFPADALPEIAPRKCVAAPNSSAFLIRG